MTRTHVIKVNGVASIRLQIYSHIDPECGSHGRRCILLEGMRATTRSPQSSLAHVGLAQSRQATIFVVVAAVVASAAPAPAVAAAAAAAAADCPLPVRLTDPAPVACPALAQSHARVLEQVLPPPLLAPGLDPVPALSLLAPAPVPAAIQGRGTASGSSCGTEQSRCVIW